MPSMSHQARCPRNALRMRQQGAEEQPPPGTLEPRPAIVLLDAGAGRFDQPTVFDAGRTSCFARAAIQAAVDVLHEAFAERQLSLIDQQHLPDASARRIRFPTPEAIRGTVIQAEAAVNATRVVLPLRPFVARAASLCAGRFGHWH